MQNFTDHEILNISARAGNILLNSNAETYRVEETCQYICETKGLKFAEAFVLPTVIILTSNTEGEQTKIRKSYDRSVNIYNICKINDFSRGFKNDTRSYAEMMEYLKAIPQKKPYPDFLYFVMCGFVSGSFTLLAGGTVYDFILSYVCGLLSGLIASYVRHLPANTFLKSFFAGIITGTIALTASNLSPKIFYEPIIVGGMKPFFPGIAILSALRDYLAGEAASGTTRLAESLLVGGSLGVGVALVLRINMLLGGSV